MKRIAIAVSLLAALGAACAKAGPDSPPPSPDGQAKAAMAAAGVSNISGAVVGLGDNIAKAALVEAGITNISGTAPAKDTKPSKPGVSTVDARFEANGKRS